MDDNSLESQNESRFIDRIEKLYGGWLRIR